MNFGASLFTFNSSFLSLSFYNKEKEKKLNRKKLKRRFRRVLLNLTQFKLSSHICNFTYEFIHKFKSNKVKLKSEKNKTRLFLNSGSVLHIVMTRSCEMDSNFNFQNLNFSQNENEKRRYWWSNLFSAKNKRQQNSYK